MTVAFSQASCAMRCARPSSIQLRATTKPASVSDSLITSAWRVAAGRSGQPSSASRIAARCPKRATIRSSENCAMSAPAFSISVRHASAPPTSAIAAATERGSVGAARDRALQVAAADRDRVDQIGIEQGRRVLEHHRGDMRLVVDQRVHHGGRRIGARTERRGERMAHQRRRIVEQHDHRAFGGDAIIRRQLGVEIGPRQRAGGLGALRGFRRAHPLQEMANDHDATEPTDTTALQADVTLCKPCGLTKRSP